MHPLSFFNFCPKCGSKEFTPDEGTSKKCHTCGFRYYLNPAPAALGIITDDKDRLLFVVRAKEPRKGALGLVGGFIEIGQSAEESLKREIKEELDLEMTEAHYLYSTVNVYHFGGFENPTLDLYYTAKVKTFDGMKALDDVADVIFIPKDKIDFEKLAFESTREAVREYLKRYPA